MRAESMHGMHATDAVIFNGRTFTAEALMAEDLPPVRWVVPDVLPEGVTLLAGKVKMGKSWMVLGMGVAAATGGIALGTKRVEQGEVLCLALEDNKRRLQNRLSKLLPGGVAPAGLHLALEWPRADEGGVEMLDDWVAIHPACRLVVIDTIARFKSRATGRRSQYDEDRDAVDPLIPIAAEHNVAIVLVHHLRETESDDPLDMIHGSAGLTGGVDGALVLKRKRGDADAYLTVEGRDIENPTELALKFDRNAATWAIVGDAEEYRLSETRRAILKVLEDADEPLGPRDVAELLGMPGNAVRQRLYQMSRGGEVRVVSRGLYAPHNTHNNHNDEDTHVTKVMDVMGPNERLFQERRRDLESGNSPQSSQPVAWLTPERIIDAIKDVRAGPRLALRSYREKPTAERFGHLVTAILVYYWIDTTQARRCAGVVRDALGSALPREGAG